MLTTIRYALDWPIGHGASVQMTSGKTINRLVTAGVDGFWAYELGSLVVLRFIERSIAPPVRLEIAVALAQGVHVIALARYTDSSTSV